MSPMECERRQSLAKSEMDWRRRGEVIGTALPPALRRSHRHRSCPVGFHSIPERWPKVPLPGKQILVVGHTLWVFAEQCLHRCTRRALHLRMMTVPGGVKSSAEPSQGLSAPKWRRRSWTRCSTSYMPFTADLLLGRSMPTCVLPWMRCTDALNSWCCPILIGGCESCWMGMISPVTSRTRSSRAKSELPSRMHACLKRRCVHRRLRRHLIACMSATIAAATSKVRSRRVYPVLRSSGQTRALIISSRKSANKHIQACLSRASEYIPAPTDGRR